MSFRAEPYGVFVDDLVTSITGGETRDTFRFLPELQPFQLGTTDVVPETVRVHGIANDAHTRFRNGIDFDVVNAVVVFRPPGANVTLPDLGSWFYASYERVPDPQAPPRLTDRNPGSIVRTLAESFAREYAVVSRQLERVYDEAFIETADGRALDQLVALVGVARRTQLFAVGEVVFSRLTPAPGDVTIDAGTLISTSDVPSVTVVTSETRTLRTGQLSISAPVQAVESGSAGIAAANKLTVIHRPILGITAVTNPTATAFRGEAETDDALRRRARWALANAGAATTAAIVGALTSVEGIADADVQVTEDHAGAPGTVTVTVATTDLGDDRARLALERLEQVRPAGVRIFHNLNVQPVAVSDAGAGGGAEDTPPPVVDVTGVFSPIKVKASVTPISATLSADEKTALVGEVEAAVRGFLAGLGVGQPLIYNQLVAAILAVTGVYDVILDVFPAAATTEHGRQNVVPTVSTRLHLEEPLDVELRGAPIALDVTVKVEPIGPTALLNRQVTLDNIATEVRALVAGVIASSGGALRKQMLLDQVPDTERYHVDDIDYGVEFVDEGLRIVQQNVDVQASSEQVLWLRGFQVVDSSDPGEQRLMAVAEQVLSRFPRHLDLDAEGKVVGDLARSIAGGLEAQISQVGKVRRAHRVREAEQVVDLIRLGGIDGFTETLLGPLARRTRLLADPATEVDDTIAQLGFEHDPDAVLVQRPDEADDTAARARFATAVRDAVRYDGLLDRGREALVDAARLVLDESGTVGGLLGATAAYLGLELTGEVSRDETGYWHLAHARDRFAVELPPGPGAGSYAGTHLLALEENPPHLADNGPIPRRHTDLFKVGRLGFDRVPVTVIVGGMADRSVHPMVVNVDDGEGVATIVDVPDGSVLRFERDGRVELDGASVARRSFRFHGAVFAAGGHPNDFVFADETAPEAFGDRAATYAVTSPISDGFDPNPGLPHGDGLLTPLELARKGARFAVFVGTGVFAREQDGTIDLAAPEPVAGFFDETVFEPDLAGDPSFEIGFEWDERETYAARIWLPAAFAKLDRDGELSIRELVRILLDRHRAAGVHVYVDFTDPRWVLGTGIVRDLDSDDALGIAVAGTEAWTDDISQPTGPLGAIAEP